MNLSVNGFNSFSIFSQRFGTAGIQEITEEMVEELTAENLEVLDETIMAEREVLTEAELLPPEEVKYKKIDILI